MVYIVRASQEVGTAFLISLGTLGSTGLTARQGKQRWFSCSKSNCLPQTHCQSAAGVHEHIQTSMPDKNTKYDKHIQTSVPHKCTKYSTLQAHLCVPDIVVLALRRTFLHKQGITHSKASTVVVQHLWVTMMHTTKHPGGPFSKTRTRRNTAMQQAHA